MKKKTLTFGSVFLLLIGMAIPTMAQSKESNIETQAFTPRSYHIVVPDFHGNGRENDGYKRSSGNSRVQWGVSLTSSGEGNGTYTRFWIEEQDGSNATADHEVKEDSGFKQWDFEGAKGAKGEQVYLTAENNNFNTNSYEVSGEWDEEI